MNSMGKFPKNNFPIGQKKLKFVSYSEIHPLYFNILMYNCVQRSFTFTGCPDTNCVFICVFFLNKDFAIKSKL